MSIVVSFLGLALLGLLVPRSSSVSFASGGGGTHTIFVSANPIHTDLLLPATPDLLSRFAFLGNDGLPLNDPRVGAIAIGWGGRTFYTQTPEWSDLTLEALWRSFTVDRSVLHLSLAPVITGEEPGMRAVTLSREAYEALLRFVAASFEPDGASGRPALLPGAGYGPYDRFYEAKGRFNLLFGCNTWTAAALRAAGQSTGYWTPLPPLLLWSLDLHAPAASAVEPAS